MAGKTKGAGRPKKILNSKDTLDKIIQYGAEGLTIGQTARMLGVSRSSLDRRRKEFDEIEEAIKKGQAKGISNISNALYNSAMDGNVTAQIFYLKTRGEEGQWNDQANVQINVDLTKALTDAHARTNVHTIEGETISRPLPYVQTDERTDVEESSSVSFERSDVEEK